MVSEVDILDEIEKTYESNGRWPGMTYEEGVRAALDWVLGNAEYAPMDG